MDNKIDLKEIINNNAVSQFIDEENDEMVLLIRKDLIDSYLEFGKQLLELAHENAWIEIDTCMGQKTGDLWVNKESILDTIKQVI